MANLFTSKSIFEVTSAKGKELRCDSIPTIQLLNSDYKTANSSFHEVQIREIVTKLFMNDSYLKYLPKDPYVKTEIMY